MSRKTAGFSIVELLVVIGMIFVIMAITIPQAFVALRGYRVHSDAAAISSQLNVTRFRATSQNTPFRLVIDGSTDPVSFYTERLCGPSGTNCVAPSSSGSCTSAYYMPFTTAKLDSGTLYFSKGNTIATTNPVSSTVFPGTIAAEAGTNTFYFNTRGMPVDCNGNPLANGGALVYLQNPDRLTDAVIVTVGGRSGVYTWATGSSQWTLR